MRNQQLNKVAYGWIGIFVLVAIMATTGSAQEFNRAVRIIAPYAPGGTSDILARIIAPPLSEAIGQPVIVENKTGASGNIGANFVAKAEKDGHTILVIDPLYLAVAPSLFSTLTFNVEKDLAPLVMVMYSPYILVVNPLLPATSVQELAAYGKANPGRISWANAGTGTINHLTALMLAKHWGIQVKHVPYKGGAAAIRGVVANESNALLNQASSTQSFVNQKQLRGLAVAGEKRLATLKDVPSFKELGLPTLDSVGRQALLTTGGTPSATVVRLNAALVKILTAPDIEQKIAKLGGEVQVSTPEQLGRWIKENIVTWGAIVREANIRVE